MSDHGHTETVRCPGCGEPNPLPHKRDCPHALTTPNGHGALDEKAVEEAARAIVRDYPITVPSLHVAREIAHTALEAAYPRMWGAAYGTGYKDARNNAKAERP